MTIQRCYPAHPVSNVGLCHIEAFLRRAAHEVALGPSLGMRALAHVYMRNVAYAHSTSLTHSRSDTLERTCVRLQDMMNG